jgi:hypothetical protein
MPNPRILLAATVARHAHRGTPQTTETWSNQTTTEARYVCTSRSERRGA